MARPRQAPEGDGPSSLGERLRDVRNKSGQSLRDVARLGDLNSGYLSQLERGDVEQPKPAALQKVARAYDLPFPTLMQWAGYIEADEAKLSPNQAMALRVLGEPSDDELKALREILNVLRTRGTATATPFHGDRPLEPETRREIVRYAAALLNEAGVDSRPTPLHVVQSAAGLVAAGELTLTLKDRERLVARFGTWVNRAWQNLLGSMDFRSDAIWVKPDLHPKRERWVRAHEIGHSILPWQRETFAYLDDQTRLNDATAALFEREANEVAAEILFQGTALRDEADGSPITLEAICDLAAAFDASIVATARRVADRSGQECAVAIAHRRQDGWLGPTHLYCSRRFESRFRWQAGRRPQKEIRDALSSAAPFVRKHEIPLPDARDQPLTLRLETLDTGYAAIAAFVRDSALKRFVRLRAQAISSG